MPSMLDLEALGETHQEFNRAVQGASVPLLPETPRMIPITIVPQMLEVIAPHIAGK